jgi:hypothetical protein
MIYLSFGAKSITELRKRRENRESESGHSTV